jgi:hypothetical protein
LAKLKGVSMPRKINVQRELLEFCIELVTQENKEDFSDILNFSSNKKLLKTIRKYSSVTAFSEKLIIEMWQEFIRHSKNLDTSQMYIFFVVDSLITNQGAILINDFKFRVANKISSHQISFAIKSMVNKKLVTVIKGKKNCSILTFHPKLQLKMRDKNGQR